MPHISRRDLVLAVFACADGADYSPVQVQKIFFLIDKKIAKEIGGPKFRFRPLDYGPFDGQVYDELTALANDGLVAIDRNPQSRFATYRLTVHGMSRGISALSTLPIHIQTYLRDLSRWVRSLTFDQLVTAIYNEFPEMKENSIFRY